MGSMTDVLEDPSTIKWEYNRVCVTGYVKEWVLLGYVVY